MKSDNHQIKKERRIPLYYFIFLMMVIFIAIFLWMSAD